MSVVKCDIPPTSALDHRLVELAYFRDSYLAPLGHPQAGIVDIFIDIFAHHPKWMKMLLLVRNSIASLFGLTTPKASEIIHFEIKDSYQVGDKMGVWPIFTLSDTEIIVGRDNKHLDFRLSVLKISEGEFTGVVVSTVCTVNNTFGKIYLFFIVPFHKWGVQQIMSNAVIEGRL
jgi:hypothetical protein